MLWLLLRLARQPFAALPRLFLFLFQSPLLFLFESPPRPLLLLLTLAARLLLVRLSFLLTPRLLGSVPRQGVGALPLERGRAFTDERLETWIARRNPETVVQETNRNLVYRLVARLCQNLAERLFPLTGRLFALAGFFQASRCLGLSSLLFRALILKRGIALRDLSVNPGIARSEHQRLVQELEGDLVIVNLAGRLEFPCHGLFQPAGFLLARGLFNLLLPGLRGSSQARGFFSCGLLDLLLSGLGRSGQARRFLARSLLLPLAFGDLGGGLGVPLGPFSTRGFLGFFGGGLGVPRGLFATRGFPGFLGGGFGLPRGLFATRGFPGFFGSGLGVPRGLFSTRGLPGFLGGGLGVPRGLFATRGFLGLLGLLPKIRQRPRDQVVRGRELLQARQRGVVLAGGELGLCGGDCLLGPTLQLAHSLQLVARGHDLGPSAHVPRGSSGASASAASTWLRAAEKSSSSTQDRALFIATATRRSTSRWRSRSWRARSRSCLSFRAPG